MISKMFYFGKIKEIEDKYIFDEEYILFYLKYKLKDKSFFTFSEAYRTISEIHDNKLFSTTGVTLFCKKFFRYNKHGFFNDLEDFEYELMNSLLDYEGYIVNVCDNFDTFIDRMSLNYNFLDIISFDNSLKDGILFFSNSSEKAHCYYLLYKYYYILKNKNSLKCEITRLINEIPSNYDLMDIRDISINDKQIDIFVRNHIFNIKDLKKLSADQLIVIFSNNIKNFISEISRFTLTKTEVIEHLNYIFQKSIKPEWIIILRKRYDGKTFTKKTLTEVGDSVNLTRERIRQIDAKIISLMMVHQDDINIYLKFLYNEIHSNTEYILVEQFVNCIDNDELLAYLFAIIDSGKTELSWDEEYRIIYNNKITTISNIIYENEIEMDDIVNKIDTRDFNEIKHIILRNNYRLFQEQVYVKKSLSNSTLFINEIKESFPKGYGVGSLKDYELLKEKIRKKYGEIDVPSQHSIQGFINRNGFVLVDKGVYLSKDYTSNLPRELADRVILFIINNSPAVYYSTIYEKFKDELMEIGIVNKYYLKGCLDPLLPNDLITDRDSIRVDTSGDYSTYDVLINVFRSFENDFSLKDIERKIPGVAEYTISNCLSLEEPNGLIKMGDKRFIYVEKLKITEEDVKKLNVIIDSLFNDFDFKVLTAKKIYSYLYYKERELLNRLNITSKYEDFELFSIIQFYLKDKYYYSRPLIGKEKGFTSTSYELYLEYAHSLEKITINDIKSYQLKMNLGILGSYLEFMDDLSDEYVQFSKDGMIRKERLEITDNDLVVIEKLLNALTNNMEFNIKYFNGYHMLPRINMNWNQYLLVGIIRTFFKNKYIIDYTTNQYDNTEFIIRRFE